MRYVQINSVPYGSTGNLMLRKHEELLEGGVDSYVVWGRGRPAESEREFNFGSKIGFYLDVVQTRLDGRAGFHSKAATRRLLKRLDEIGPDVVHLHNLHGYYVNIEMLFDWLAERDCQVKWTLHDCWAFTGHCAYFTYAECSQWKTGCGKSGRCPQSDEYPMTLNSSACMGNYSSKSAVFNKVSSERLSLITPSRWLADLARQSFLGEYPVEVLRNGIDTGIFKPTKSDFRKEHGIEDDFIILGAALQWSERKGLDDFVKLVSDLDSRFALMLIGLSEKQKKALSAKAKGSSVKLVLKGPVRTGREMAEAYSAADIFFNPTREDNFPSANLEALACGSSVITYDVGGCAETLETGVNRAKHAAAVRGYDEALDLMLSWAALDCERA